MWLGNSVVECSHYNSIPFRVTISFFAYVTFDGLVCLRARAGSSKMRLSFQFGHGSEQIPGRILLSRETYSI